MRVKPEWCLHTGEWAYLLLAVPLKQQAHIVCQLLWVITTFCTVWITFRVYKGSVSYEHFNCLPLYMKQLHSVHRTGINKWHPLPVPSDKHRPVYCALYNSRILKMPTAIVKSRRHICTRMDDLWWILMRLFHEVQKQNILYHVG